MNKFAKGWLKALRSGKYRRTVGNLCNEGKFCCLGVACKSIGMTDEEIKCLRYGTDRNSLLPKKLQEKFGISAKLMIGLQRRNDGEGEFEVSTKTLPGISFKKIADYIEKELK